MELQSFDQCKSLFQVSLDNDFWLTHYSLDKESKPKPKKTGKQFILHIVINAVVPFLFALSRYNRGQEFGERAIKLLENLEVEKNAIIRNFGELGFTVSSSFDSQGLIELKRNYCDKRRCLNCKIGVTILKKNE